MAKRNPTCVVCGKSLPRFVSREQLTRDKVPRGDPRWYRSAPNPELTGDGMPPTWGRHGNNILCGAGCGYVLAIRLCSSDPDVVRLLPPQHDPAIAAEAQRKRRNEASRTSRLARIERRKRVAKVAALYPQQRDHGGAR